MSLVWKEQKLLPSHCHIMFILKILENSTYVQFYNDVDWGDIFTMSVCCCDEIWIMQFKHMTFWCCWSLYECLLIEKKEKLFAFFLKLNHGWIACCCFSNWLIVKSTWGESKSHVPQVHPQWWSHMFVKMCMLCAFSGLICAQAIPLSPVLPGGGLSYTLFIKN